MDLYQRIKDVAVQLADKTYLASRNTELSYRETLERASLLERRIASCGVLERPCLIQAKDITASIAVLACLGLKKPFIVVNPNSPRDRLDYYIRDSGANVLISSADADAPPSLQWESLGVTSLGTPPEHWRTVTDSRSVACLIYTSGSTGQPKAVVCPREAMSFASASIGTALAYGQEDVVLTALPMFFDFGLYQLFLAGAVGATVYFASDLESGLGLGEVLPRTGATILPMVPPAAEKLASLARKGLSKGAVRMITTTGAALAPDTRLTLAQEWDSGVDVRVMYGLTECKRVAIMPAFESSRRAQASGLPLPGTTVTIRPHGCDAKLGADQVGEICVEGPHVMAGYHNQPDLTARRYRRTSSGTVLRTGDTGFLDAAGYLHCFGRDDDQFKIQGYRVSTTEVIAAAKSVADVVSVAVVPPAQGRRYTLFFQGKASASAVARALAERLEPYAVPKRVQRLETVPTNANGKVDMKELQKRANNG